MSEVDSFEANNPAYVAVAVSIFTVVAFTFLFPCNCLIPLDRRTIAVVGAIACYLTRTYMFPSNPMNILAAIDFNVLILLASIMVINHIVIHLRETKRMIKYFQSVIKSNPTRGFWMVSLLAFAVSPFLTNDGVCLLLVEPILFAFHDLSDGNETNRATEIEKQSSFIEKLEKGDIIYFLFALACSTNIGSSLTYTGNPQNMIVASDAILIMPSYKFLLYMLLPAFIAWLLSKCFAVSVLLSLTFLFDEAIKYVEWCWKTEKKRNCSLFEASHQNLNDEEKNPMILSQKLRIAIPVSNREIDICDCLNPEVSPMKSSAKTPLSPRRKKAKENDRLVKRVVKVVSSPIPYCVLVILFLMIVLIFINVMPIAGLICLIAIIMVLFIVMGNHWKDSMVWEEESFHSCASSNRVHRRSRAHSRNLSAAQFDQKDTEASLSNEIVRASAGIQPIATEEVVLPITPEDKIDNLNEFFEDLFGSIDYSLLLIFLGTFIVVENLGSTGIPRAIFRSLVGRIPFSTLSSIVGVSSFVLIASQLLGNVAVVQLAKPNVHDLNEDQKRFAWALISFVSTIGGNLTIAGSAANIIVAEKANRMDASINFDFFRHFRVCFGVTLVCCIASGSLLSFIVMIDNRFGSKW